MGCDETGSDNGMQFAISKRKCHVMRSHEMRKEPTLKKKGAGMECQEIVAVIRRRLGRTL